jgi:Cysteine rich repeat
MTIRHLLPAALLSLGVIVLPGSTRTANAADPLAYCKSDVARLCPGVTAGGGKLIGCLKEHENEISVGCAKALKAIKTKMGK